MTTYAFRAVAKGDKPINADININAAAIQAGLNAFPGANIQTNTIPGDRIVGDSMQGSKLVALAVDTAQLAPGAATTVKFGDLAVATAKIDNTAVTQGKFALGAVGEAQLAAGIAEVKVGTYTGDGLNSHSIQDVGFSPIAVFIVKDTANTAVHMRLAGMVVAKNLSAGGAATSSIISLDSGGFTVTYSSGGAEGTNASGVTYTYLAIGTT